MTPDEIAARAEEVAADLRSRGHCLHLDHAGASTAYRSDEVDTGEWIRQLFDGYFVPSDAAQADATLYSSADAGLYTSLQGLTPQRPAGGKYDYAEIPFTDSVVLIRKEAGKVTPREDVFLLLFVETRSILLVTSGNLEVRREEGMQILRALHKWLLLERGWIPMHSACAANNGRTICITGLKAAGKTSTLLNLLARNGCDLLAVDKFLLRDAGSHLEVCGIPGKIGVRVGSAVAQPRVLDWLSESTDSFFPHMSREEVEEIAATNTPEQLRTRGEKIHLTPAELARLFGRTITLTAPLGLVLIPVYDPHLEHSRLVPAGPDEVLGLLRKCYVSLQSKSEGFLLHLFDLSDAVLEARLTRMLTDHLPEVPSAEIHQSHRTNEQTAELVAGLL